jgi:transposase-like protein
MNLIDVSKHLATDEQCLAFLERVRWPDGTRCPTCGNDKIGNIERKSRTKNKRVQLYVCLEPTCKQQFSATSGTLFHDSHLPLHKWFLAIALIMDAKKGISAKQLERHLEVNYRTAWYLAHRIRKAMADGNGGGLLSGIVEVDETYVGGHHKGHGAGPHTGNKDIVVGIRQRGGSLRMIHVADISSDTLGKHIRENVAHDVEMVVTDEYSGYPPAMVKAGVHGSKHKTIRHKSGVYVQGDVHTNTVESAFSLFKRGIVGSFHKVSIKHLNRYLSEFEFRFNNRDNQNLFRDAVKHLVITKQMPYRELTAEKIQ